MASEEQDLDTTGRGRRGRRPSTRPQAQGNPGLLRVLLADLRKQRIPSEPDAEELAWLEEQEERLRAEGAKIGKVHTISAEQRENLRRRYWNGS